MKHLVVVALLVTLAFEANAQGPAGSDRVLTLTCPTELAVGEIGAFVVGLPSAYFEGREFTPLSEVDTLVVDFGEGAEPRDVKYNPPQLEYAFEHSYGSEGWYPVVAAIQKYGHGEFDPLDPNHDDTLQDFCDVLVRGSLDPPLPPQTSEPKIKIGGQVVRNLEFKDTGFGLHAMVPVIAIIQMVAVLSYYSQGSGFSTLAPAVYASTPLPLNAPVDLRAGAGVEIFSQSRPTAGNTEVGPSLFLQAGYPMERISPVVNLQVTRAFGTTLATVGAGVQVGL